MKKIVFILFVAVISAWSSTSKLITVDQLASQLNDPNLVILHVAALRAEYNREHIPGARFLWPGWLTEQTPEASNEPAPLAKIKASLEKLGINNDSRIVLYCANGFLFPACRVFFTLDYIGLGEQTAILNGGLEEWKKNGKPVATDLPTIKKSKLKIKPRAEVFFTAGQIQQNLQNANIAFVDVRPAAYYEGKSGSPRAGHIPAAINLPLQKLYDEKTFTFYAKEKVIEDFNKIKLTPDHKVIAICATGNSASTLYFLCREWGYPVALYDGSMEEWSNRFDLPMEKINAEVIK